MCEQTISKSGSFLFCIRAASKFYQCLNLDGKETEVQKIPFTFLTMISKPTAFSSDIENYPKNMKGLLRRVQENQFEFKKVAPEFHI